MSESLDSIWKLISAKHNMLNYGISLKERIMAEERQRRFEEEQRANEARRHRDNLTWVLFSKFILLISTVIFKYNQVSLFLCKASFPVSFLQSSAKVVNFVESFRWRWHGRLSATPSQECQHEITRTRTSNLFFQSSEQKVKIILRILYFNQ